jgi:predicted phage baseplate assembly protein
LSARAALQWSLRDAQPAITLSDANGTVWTARRDLLNSSGDAEEFVVEIDNDGAAVIRFGDDTHGRRPEPGTAFFAHYRVGNGLAGNIGADSLKHIALNIPEILAMHNPLSAAGGQDPESLEDARPRAPVAYRVQERAVTPADYAEVTERYPDVQRAAATLRWTGSWHTVFLTVDQEGGAALTEKLETDIRNHVERYRMAGHDLEVDEPQFVSLEIDLHVCVGAEHFRGDVERELYDIFSNRDLPDGRRGLFHPDNFTFGQPVYLSAIYAAAHQVMGVDSVEVRTFQRLGVADSTALESGRLDIDRLEIARLDNDRNFGERGQLTISLGGGK